MEEIEREERLALQGFTRYEDSYLGGRTFDGWDMCHGYRRRLMNYHGSKDRQLVNLLNQFEPRLALTSILPSFAFDNYFPPEHASIGLS